VEHRKHKLLVADDHAIVRKGIIQVLQDSPDLLVQGEAASGAEVLERVRAEDWDGVVMDLSMPGTSGLDLIKQLRALRPRLPILVLSVHPEDQYALRVLKAGAGGYLTKESVPDELVRAIRKVCAGGRYVSAELAERLAFSMGADVERAPHEQLSDREFQVLRLMASGLTPTEISERLCLSVKTVSTYRTRLLEKLRLRTSAELVRYAVQAGLVE
jgi:two-component system invasion response regulator UvrY